MSLISEPRVPWFVMHRIRDYWPSLFNRIVNGTWNPNTSEHWDEAWDRHGKGGFRATKALQEVRQFVLENISRGSETLDVGCGVGELLQLLRDQKGCSCSGIDISKTAVASAVERGFDARVSALPQIPFESARFEVVTCTETLEHVTEVRSSIREIARVLKPGGTFILSVPDGKTDREAVHVHRFTTKRLRQMLNRWFEIVSVRTFSEDGSDVIVLHAKKKLLETKNIDVSNFGFI